MTELLPEVARLVDLDRYPIHDPPRALIAGWRAEFERTGACNLQGFVTPAGAAELAVEAEALMPQAYRKTYTRNCLFEFDDDSESAAGSSRAPILDLLVTAARRRFSWVPKPACASSTSGTR